MRKKEEDKGMEGLWKDVEGKRERENAERGDWDVGKSEWQVVDVGNEKEKIRKQELDGMLRNI